jgi:hypothetical protein
MMFLATYANLETYTIKSDSWFNALKLALEHIPFSFNSTVRLVSLQHIGEENG